MNQTIRKQIANRLEKLTKDKGSVFLAPWDNRRLSWESNSVLEYAYYEDMDNFYELLDKACDDTGYFIELINGCEGHICKA